MIITPEHPEKPITAWRCGCRPESMRIGLSHKTCPYCHKAMPQIVYTTVYQQVLRELKAEVLRIESKRWDRIARFTSRSRRFYRVLTVLAIVAWSAALFLVGIRNLPGITEKLPILLQGFPRLWQKVSALVTSLFASCADTLKSVPWEKLLNKLEGLPMDTIFRRLGLLIATLFKAIGLFFQWIADLFNLIRSFISSLLS